MEANRVASKCARSLRIKVEVKKGVCLAIFSSSDLKVTVDSFPIFLSHDKAYFTVNWNI